MMRVAKKGEKGRAAICRRAITWGEGENLSDLELAVVS